MGSLRRRVETLEGDRCACSAYELPEWGAVEVVWDDGEAGDLASEADDPERCPECGRRLVFTVTWGDSA